MRRRSYLLVSLLACSGALIPACSDTAAAIDEAAILKDLSENVAKPLYRALSIVSAAMKKSVAAFAKAPSASGLGDAQKDWKATATAWNRTRAFAFGPAKDIEPSIRWKNGCDVAAVEANITAGKTDVMKLGTAEKGLPTLEFLLFDTAGGNDAILAKFNDAASGAARIAYLGSASEALATDIDSLVGAWDAHAGELATAGNGSTVYKSPKDGMDALVNQVLYAADVAINQINVPFAKTGKVAPELEEARLSDNTLIHTEALLLSVRATFDGAFEDNDGFGLADLIRDRSADLGSVFAKALEAAETSVKAIPPPLRLALEKGDTAKLGPAVAAIREVKSLLASDIASALGVTISFSDMDGD
jgi:uncharacterized protein